MNRNLKLSDKSKGGLDIVRFSVPFLFQMTTILVFILSFCLTTIGSAGAADWEYEPLEGLHQEEWYDPSDWFNENAEIDMESDWYGFYYDYPFDYGDDYYDGIDYYGYYDYYDPTDEAWDANYDYETFDYHTQDWWDENSEFMEWL